MGKEERKLREKRIQREFRRGQIMAAAKKVFLSKGFNGTTMEDIANEAELSIGALYLYFNNKDELYASINVELQKYMRQRVQELAENNQLNPSQKIEALSGVLYESYAYDPSMMVNLLQLQASESLKNLSQETLASINNILGQTLQPLSKIFEDGVREGFFEDHIPVAVGDIIWAIFSGLVLWEESKKMFAPRKDYLKATLNLAMKIVGQGIAKKKP